MISRRQFSSSSTQHIFGALSKTLSGTATKPFKVEPILRPIGLSSPISLNTLNNAISGVGIEVFNKDVRMRKREVLQKELSISGMHDVHIYRKTNGKVFISPPSYFKADKSLYFPNFMSKTLDGQQNILFDKLKGKVNIVRAYTALSGDKSSQTFFKTAEGSGSYLYDSGFRSFQQEYPNSQIIEVNITENFLKALIVKLSAGKLRSSVPKERQSTFFTIARKLFPRDIREEINMYNLYSGYVYVLDSEGRIRWAVCGDSTEAEYALLWKCVRSLEKELLSASEK